MVAIGVLAAAGVVWYIFKTPAPFSNKFQAPPTTPATSSSPATPMALPGKPGDPIPPAGDKPHRYIFTVHALKVDSLPLDASAPGAMVGFYLSQNTIGKTSFTRTYAR